MHRPTLGSLVINGFIVLQFLAAPVQAEDAADLKTTMNKNFEALMNLQPFAADQNAFSDPKNKEAIQRNLDALSGLQHVFPQKMADQEPGLAAISLLFSNYVSDIKKSFANGANGGYVRNEVRTMTGYCLSCHTRVATDRVFTDVASKVDAASLTDFDRAEFYAATRQFDKAAAAFEKIITDAPSGELAYIVLGRGIRELLSITVRVKQDPQATLKILEKLRARDDLPEFFTRYLGEWIKDVKSWQQETKKPADMKPAELIAKAKSLIDQAASRQLFQLDPTADVNYLRATSYIHEALQREPKGKFRAQALYLLGVCYDALQDPLLWALDSLYFEQCIREFPHTEPARKCYTRYAAKLYFGYSGSGGTYVPEDELKKLAELRKLSQ